MTEKKQSAARRVSQAARAAWEKTSRARAGASAAWRVTMLVGNATRAISAAPLPPQPDVARTPEASQTQRLALEAEGSRRLREVGEHELNQRVAEQKRVVDNLQPPATDDRAKKAARSASQERTRTAAQADRSPAARSQSRGQSRTTSRGRGR